MGKVKKIGKANNSSVKGVPLKKECGQHLLKNPGIVSAIIEKSNVKSTDVVLEVGPGTGNLSMKILEKSSKLIAYETDQRMIAELKKRVVGTPVQYKLEIHSGDVIKAKDWPRFDVCVSNLPYQISSPFIFRLLNHRPLPRYAVLMLQKEFADRLIAKPGSKVYCRLSANVQLLSKVEHLMKVKRSEFRPPPKVDSAVIRIEPRNPPPPIDLDEWDGLLRLVFVRKNKKLLTILKKKPVVEMLERNYSSVCESKNKEPEKFCMKERIEWLLRDSGFAEKRARTMAVEDFLSLLLLFNEADLHFIY